MARENLFGYLDEGIRPNFDPDLRRAFEFSSATVPDSLKQAEKLKFNKDMLKVSGDGVFYTLQGEGSTMGLPAAFLRLHICNLRCSWCDAWYTWNPNTPEFWTESEDWTIEKTIAKVEEAWSCKDPKVQKRLVITGGEPLLQQQQIIKLLAELPQWQIEIETNGTIKPEPELIERCQFNCSPKLKNSHNSPNSRIRPEVIETFKHANTMFKFVITSAEDINELQTDYIENIGIDPNQIIVMPQGVTSEEVMENAQKIIDLAKEKGYRLMTRLHVDLWGARRRV